MRIQCIKAPTIPMAIFKGEYSTQFMRLRIARTIPITKEAWTLSARHLGKSGGKKNGIIIRGFRPKTSEH